MMDSGGLYSIVIALCVVAVTILFLFLLRRIGSSKEKTVLLCGTTGSGKTAMFLRLVTGKCVPTFVSSAPNEADVQFGKSTLRIVDLPGSEELRSFMYDRLRRPPTGVIFVIDSSTISKESKHVVEYLYELLLAVKEKSGSSVKFLVACTKQDLVSAKSSSSVKTTVQREFEVLNKTRERALDSTQISGLSGKNATKHPIHGGESQLKLPADVEFFDCCSYISNQPDGGVEKVSLKGVKDWLRSL